MKQILAEEAAKVLKEREAAAAKIEALKTEREEVIPKLKAEIARKEANYLRQKPSWTPPGMNFNHQGRSCRVKVNPLLLLSVGKSKF